MAKGRFSGWRTATAPRVQGTGLNMNGNGDLIIGIDPDVDKCGLAFKFKSTGLKELKTVQFWELIEWMQVNKANIKVVVIEAGHLNKKSNFRSNQQTATAMASANPMQELERQKRIGETIAMKVGRNHETGILLAHFCRRYNIPYLEVQPKAHKVTSTRMFEQMHGIKTKKSDQEQRDAWALIAGL